ncbi:MarR family winged helix-turn-helix transcriptional regulator [Levilactobacillus tujiorum]|uniref:Winged helix DNA-binding protein n=1 Tax=Levilactobacillus tujiorum TaxID=2912243 RepID=A0ABX1L2F2_9LACO|nr:MarR family transcriptional regulator [Levilactobacillus tujiorum]MCH5464068.1 MarR family transcriptional regulator [Levilactobacillus tujiorum]NLR11168.1 winged helix DNA-binding protein [Lactobacillus sp. HBUAS51387]NLR29205.1 winged helix DNA-binding protein [Levilactobacillus tujiorum]NLR31518.1 winged helix DNA-binding protein [Levilactobacillus tujiorum]
MMEANKLAVDVQRIHQLNSLLRPFIKRPSSGDAITFEQYRILHELAMEKISTSELARRLNVGQSMISIQISRLLNNGYIDDETLATDRRYHVFEITPRGRRIEEHVSDVLNEELPELIQQLTEIVNAH